MTDHLTIEVRYVLLGVFAALVVASATSIGLMKAKPANDWRELRARIRTWWVIAGLVAGSLLLSPTTAIWFFAFVSFLSLKEFFSLIPSRRADRRVMFWAYAAIPMQYYWIASNWYGMFIIFIPIYLFLFLPTRMILIGETKGFLQAIATVQWGVIGTTFFLSHAAYLLVMNVAESPRVEPAWANDAVASSPGPGLLLLLLVLTQSNDVAQFLWGKTLGKRKIAPLVSPGKTWGGFLGGLATTVLLSLLLAPRLTMMDAPHAAIAGVIIGITGLLGDLNISALKRDLGVKDAGATLPGHGGVLDRIDSLIFTAPVFFHFVWYCYG
ncbi:phosphatidate cytidylyltransferase [Neorhodopirellula lusitana]|uniref:phosphatidate cytidylyltransferase n=1 Tax=Neorhodopirellula lusitana TaxID=445327 RepID=UPI00384A8D4E